MSAAQPEASVPASTPAPALTPALPVSKLGAVVRMSLSCVITFGVALQTAHGQGMKMDGWVIGGALLLALKDIQSFINQAWSKAFHEVRATDASALAPENAAP